MKGSVTYLCTYYLMGNWERLGWTSAPSLGAWSRECPSIWGDSHCTLSVLSQVNGRMTWRAFPRLLLKMWFCLGEEEEDEQNSFWGGGVGGMTGLGRVGEWSAVKNLAPILCSITATECPWRLQKQIPSSLWPHHIWMGYCRRWPPGPYIQYAYWNSVWAHANRLCLFV